MTGGNKKNDEWPQWKMDKLTEMWAKGFSGREIGRELGGLSRCAVIGKAYRMKLEPRKARIAVGERKRKKRVRNRTGFNFASQSSKPQKVQEPRPPKETLIAPAVEGGLPLIALKTSQCHAVVKEHCYQTHELARYCGNPVYGDFAYCEGHYIAFHQEPRPRVR